MAPRFHVQKPSRPGGAYLVLRTDPSTRRRVVARATSAWQAQARVTELVRLEAAKQEQRAVIKQILEAQLSDGTPCIDLRELDIYHRLEAIASGTGITADKPALLTELSRRGLPHDRPLFTKPQR